MTIYNLYIFDRHCTCIYYQKWSHKTPAAEPATSMTGSTASQINNSSRLGSLTGSSRFSTSSTASSVGESTNISSRVPSQNTQSGLAAGSVISIEEEAKLVYGVVLSLRNFVRKLSGSNEEGFISYKTSAYRLHYYETPTGLKFVMNSDPNTENLKFVLKQIHVQLYVEFVVKNGLMRFDDTRWEFSQNEIPDDPNHAPTGSISNELFRIAVDRFVRSLKSF